MDPKWNLIKNFMILMHDNSRLVSNLTKNLEKKAFNNGANSGVRDNVILKVSKDYTKEK